MVSFLAEVKILTFWQKTMDYVYIYLYAVRLVQLCFMFFMCSLTQSPHNIIIAKIIIKSTFTM